MTGSVIVSLSFPVMMASMAATASGWRRLILLYGVPMLLLGLPRFLFVKEDPAIDAGVQHDKVHLKDIFKMLASNKYIWFYAVVMLCFSLTTNLGATAYYFDYVVHNPAIQGIFSALAIMILPLMLFMPPLLKKFGAPQLIGATAVQQPETVLFTIRCLYSLIPMVIMLLLAFFAFKLSKLNKQLPEIERTLAERKER